MADKSSCPHPIPHEQQLQKQPIAKPVEPNQPSEITPSQAEFQKNYPKNIFIPLIEYLTQLGYKQAYQNCVGRREQFQGKNVVSLSSIFTLITQDWFCRNINKQSLLAHISNKILINSKIKKKLFHILIAHMILVTGFTDVKDFKRRVSKQANMIAKRSIPQDELFSYPSAIIFLLHTFRKILVSHVSKKGYLKLQEEFEQLSLEQAPAIQAKGKTNGSKEEYKFYVKEVVHILNGKGLQIHKLTDILEETKQSILEKDKNIREKYQLVQGIPNWIHFIETVVLRCFQYKRKDTKITNFLLNEWISECKTKILCVFQQKPEIKTVCVPPQTQNYWQTGSIDWNKSKFNFISPDNKNKQPQLILGKPLVFKPIIISLDSQMSQK